MVKKINANDASDAKNNSKPQAASKPRTAEQAPKKRKKKVPVVAETESQAGFREANSNLVVKLEMALDDAQAKELYATGGLLCTVYGHDVAWEAVSDTVTAPTHIFRMAYEDTKKGARLINPIYIGTAKSLFGSVRACGELMRKENQQKWIEYRAKKKLDGAAAAETRLAEKKAAKEAQAVADAAEKVKADAKAAKQAAIADAAKRFQERDAAKVAKQAAKDAAAQKSTSKPRRRNAA